MDTDSMKGVSLNSVIDGNNVNLNLEHGDGYELDDVSTNWNSRYFFFFFFFNTNVDVVRDGDTNVRATNLRMDTNLDTQVG